MRTDRGFDKRSERRRWWGAVTLSLLAHGVVLGMLSRVGASLAPLPSDPIILRFIQPTPTPQPTPNPTPTPQPILLPQPMPLPPPEVERPVIPLPPPGRPVVRPVTPAVTATPTAVAPVPRRTAPRVSRVDRMIVSLPNVPEVSEIPEVSIEEVVVSETIPIPNEQAPPEETGLPEGIDRPIRPVFPTTSIVTGQVPNTVYVSNASRAVLSARVDTTLHPELSTTPTPSPEVATLDAFIPPRPRHSPQPAYPESARQNRQAGVVRIAATVSADGLVTDVRIAQSSGFPVLDNAALEAVRQWQFIPARRGSVGVAALVTVPVRFRLDSSY